MVLSKLHQLTAFDVVSHHQNCMVWLARRSSNEEGREADHSAAIL